MKKIFILAGIIFSVLIGSAQWIKLFPNLLEGEVYYAPLAMTQLSSGDLVLLYGVGPLMNAPGIICLSASDGSIKWQTPYVELTSADNITSTSDGGFAVAGQNYSIDAGATSPTYKLSCIKFNQAGAIQWQHIVEDGMDTYGYLSVKQNNEGLIAVAGTYGNTATGDTGVFEILNPDNGYTTAKSITPDRIYSGFDTIGAEYYCYASGSTLQTTGIFLIDANGDSVWRQPYPFVPFSNSYAASVFTAADGGCIVDRGDSMVEISLGGIPLWERKGINGTISKLHSNGYLLSVESASELTGPILFTGYDTNLDSIWAYAYFDSTRFVIPVSGFQLQDNSFAGCAKIINADNMLVYKTSSNSSLNAPTDSVYFSNGYSRLSSNNINVMFEPDGGIAMPGIPYIPSFIVPAGDSIPKATIFASGMVIGAKDDSGNIYTAVKTYNTSPTDLWPGPLSNRNVDPAPQWNKVWYVSLEEIRTHLQDFLQHHAITNPIPDIFSWPGNGNVYATGSDSTSITVTGNMAPFVDLNHNGIYEPQFGEYPDIKGDAMLFFVCNDAYLPHQASNSAPLNLQIRVSAYEYNCPDSTLFNTLFTEIKLDNKSSRDYHNFYYGQWVDFDIGCYENDRAGCDTLSKSFYAYNGTIPDPDCGVENGYGYQMPVQTVTWLNQDMYAHLSDAYFENGAPLPEPNYASNIFYDNLVGYWNDTMPFTYGGNGYGDSIPFRYMYDGNPDDSSQWSQCTAGIISGDVKSMSSTGPFFLAQDSTIDIELAYTFHPNIYPELCFNYDPIQLQLTNLIAEFNNNSLPTCEEALPAVPDSLIIYSVNDLAKNGLTATVYPNPASFEIIIRTSNFNPQTIAIYDMSGAKVLEQQYSARVKITSLPAGVYMMQLSNATETIQRKFVKLNQY